MTVKVEVVLGELWRAGRRVEQNAQTPSLAPAAYFAFFVLRFYTLKQHCDVFWTACLHGIRHGHLVLFNALQRASVVHSAWSLELASSHRRSSAEKPCKYQAHSYLPIFS
jgi:hypothetical protein